MQFTSNGPDIPIEILDAQEKNELVIFTGAGISKPARLPLFGELTDRIIKKLNAEPDRHIEEELCRGNFDRVFNWLEKDFGRKRIAAELKKELNSKSSSQTSHSDLIDLATGRDERLRLVTTNFDPLFDSTGKIKSAFEAPSLPVPKPHKWNGLVYLHGRVDFENEFEENNLVITSGDFGQAYLHEGWAANFVTELFRHYRVLFIGYSANDPIIRYLMDAIASDQKHGIEIKKPYAFADYEEGGQKDAEKAWEHKNIQPIAFDRKNNFELQHKTLSNWAKRWNGGLEAKKELIRTYGVQDPYRLGKDEEHERNQFYWALSDPDGSVAKEFRGLGRKAHLNWVFALNEDLKNNNVDLSEERKWELTLEGVLWEDKHLVSRQTPSQVQIHLSEWLIQFLDDESFLLWFINSQKFSTATFSRNINLELDKIQNNEGEYVLSEVYIKLWKYLCSMERAINNDQFLGFDLKRRIENDQISYQLKQDVLKEFSPQIVLRSNGHLHEFMRQRFGEFKKTEKDTEVSQLPEMQQLVDIDLQIPNNSTTVLVDCLKENDNPLLEELAFEFTNLLKDTLEWLAYFEKGDKEYDQSAIRYPVIGSDDKIKYRSDWSVLVDICWHAFIKLKDSKPELASTLVKWWSSIEFPVFRRLVWAAMSQDDISQEVGLYSRITNKPELWLWNPWIRNELFQNISKFTLSLKDAEREEFINMIAEGPPESMYRKELPKEKGQVKKITDRKIWERLTLLEREGVNLTDNAIKKLKALNRQYPKWKLSDEYEYPVFRTGSGGWVINQVPSDAIDQMNEDEIVDELLRETQNYDFDAFLERWRHYIATDLSKNLTVTKKLVSKRDKKKTDKEVWEYTFAGLSNASYNHDQAKKALAILRDIPDDVVKEVITMATFTFKAITSSLSESETLFFEVWDRLFQISEDYSMEIKLSDDILNTAINHPKGVMGEILFITIGKLVAEDSSQVFCRMEYFISNGAQNNIYGRVVFVSDLQYLYSINQEWTKKNLISCLDWSDPQEATSMWAAYLFHPRLSPELFEDLKDHFIATFNHLDKLGSEQENLASVLFVVSMNEEFSFSNEDTARCIRQFPAEYRHYILTALKNTIRGEEQNVEKYWSNYIKPWLHEYWPHDKHIQTPDTSLELAQICIKVGNKFQEAVETVKELLKPIERDWGIIDDLTEKSFADKYPESTFTLLERLTGKNPEAFKWDAKEVVKLLDTIATHKPEIAEKQRFQDIKSKMEGLIL